MKDLEDLIWEYGQLPSARREDVDRRVRDHPALRDLLEEVKALYACIDDVHALTASPPGGAALAYFIANQYIQRHAPPPELMGAYTRLASQVEHEEGVRRRYLELKRRMEDVASASDPESEFERLSGFRAEDYSEETRSGSMASLFIHDRQPLPGRARREAGRVAGAALATASGAALLCLFLWLAGANERIAYTESSDLFSDAQMSYTRAVDLPVDSLPDDLLVMQAQLALLDAQRVWLNTAYWYEEEKLAEAEELFLLVLKRGGSSPRLRAVGSYFLGKIHLARGHMSETVDYLEEAVRLRDVWSAEAEALLKKIKRGW